ncbi:MAG: RNA 2',3'-cyclic phosphodiesterase [Anaerolineae bacterium]|nr:RNA 2',3'-cyclic phosphodiesterase [Anaerolineae bacterium]
MQTIRAFTAIPLPKSVLDHLGRIQRKLQSRIPHRGVRWVPPAAIHVTLKFLGDISVSKVPEIEQALQAVARHAPECTFSVAGLSCFPSLQRPRVIWVGIAETSGRITALHGAIEEAVAPFGFEREGRGFKPHLTLGRVSRRANQTDAARIGSLIAQTEALTVGEVTADHFCLIQSTLKPSGAEYTIIRRFDLR